MRDIRKLTDNSHPEKAALDHTLVVLSEAAQAIDSATGFANRDKEIVKNDRLINIILNFIIDDRSIN